MYPIPANATRIRYLESTGAQYIDTGISMASNSAVPLKVSVDSFGVCEHGLIHNNVAAGTWLGVAALAVINSMRIYKDNYNTKITREYSSTRNTHVWDGASGFYEDGVLVDSFTAGVGTDNITGINWRLGRLYDFYTGSPRVNDPPGYRIYSAQMWLNGVLVRDFRPVRKNGVGYLFDRVSGTLFGNSGTGDFVLGPDTFARGVIPTRMMVGGVRKKLWPTPLYTGVSLVGSSVQNNNGILSGFTSSSYATMPFYWTAGVSQIEAVCKFTKSSSTTTAEGIWGCVGSTNAFTPIYHEGNGPLGAYLSIIGNGTWPATPHGVSGTKVARYQPNNNNAGAGTYVLKFCYHEQTVEMFKYENGAWTRYSNFSFSAINGEPSLVPQLGTNRGSNNPLKGTIDLNYTYLYRDGELWWEGVAGAYKNVKTAYPD